LAHLIAVLSVLLLPTTFAVQTKTDDAYQKFLDKATDYFELNATRVNEEYQLGHYHWDLDQASGKLVFSENGTPRVIARVQIVGSYSTSSHTWKWSWADDTVLKEMKKETEKVKRYGEQHGFKELTTSQFECDEDYAWTLITATAYVLKYKRAYRTSIDNGYMYMLISDIRWADDKLNPKKHGAES
jgi:hypothetical protein